MKLKNSGLIALSSLTQLFELSPSVKGYKAYINRAGIPVFGIKAPELLKKLIIKNKKDLLNLFKNAKPLTEQTGQFNPKAAEGLKKIIQNGKKVFLFNVLNGGLPAGCM